MDDQADVQRPKRRQFWLGLIWGCVPLVIWSVAIGLLLAPWVLSYYYNTLFGVLALSLLGYVAALIAAVVCLFIRRVRFVGYGLLTAVLTTPIIGAVGCDVILQLIRRGSLY